MRLLDAEEISNFPFEIVYCAAEEQFKSDEKEAFQQLVKVIELMNKMEEKDWHSYPLGTIIALQAVYFPKIRLPGKWPSHERDLRNWASKILVKIHCQRSGEKLGAKIISTDFRYFHIQITQMTLLLTE